MKKRLMSVFVIMIAAFCQPSYNVAPVREIKAAEVTTASNIEAEMKEQIIMKKLGVKLTALGIEENTTNNCMSLKVLIESSYQADLEMQVEDLSVNGFMYQGDDINPLLAKQGMKEASNIDIPKDFLEMNHITKIQTIDFRLTVYTVEGHRIYFYHMVQVKMNSKANDKQVIDSSGRVIYDKNNVKVVTKGLDALYAGSEFNNHIYIENNSKSEIYIQFTASSELFAEDCKRGYRIMPGKRLNAYLKFDSIEVGQADYIEIGFSIHEKGLSGKELGKVNFVKLPMNISKEPVGIDGRIIYDKDGIRVVATSLEETDKPARSSDLKVSIENNSSSEIKAFVNNLVVNDFMARKSDFESLLIKPGMKKEGMIQIASEDIEHSCFDRVGSIEFKMAFFKDNRMTVSEVITINTSLRNRLLPTFDMDGKTIYDANDIKIVYQGQKCSVDGDCYCDFYIENNTQTDTYMDIVTEAFVMEEKDRAIQELILAGRKAYYSLKLDKNRKEEPDIKFKFTQLKKIDTEGMKRKIIETERIYIPSDR